MKAITVLIIAMLVLGCESRNSEHHYLLGTWKSNEKMTLESMNGNEGVTEKARTFLENDFFGQLVAEYKENEYRAVNEKDDYDTGYQPYEVVAVEKGFIRIKGAPDILGDTETTIYPAGECFYMIVTKFEFREYFCKVK